VHYRGQYVLLKKDGQWRIDSKKIWSRAAETPETGWQWTIL
jgi:hypothetical protein